MSDIEKRARELLAAEYVKEGRAVSAQETMQGHDLTAHAEYIALRAIVAALTPPDGYVLVPVDVQKDAERYRFLRQYTVDSYLAGGIGEQLDLSIDAAMLAARLEVQ